MKKNNKIGVRLQIITVLVATILALGCCLKNSYALLQINTPQILIILDNSQSMDGDLSGAIMTGSGTVPADTSSSSPINYTVPSGFTAPETGAASGTSTEYTYSAANGNLIDNSASRLNVAKAAIMAAYNEWSGYAEFGLMDYGVQGSPSVYTTWVYYMSGPNGFQFGTTASAPTQTNSNGQVVQLQSVLNPCYQSSTNSCNSIENLFGSAAESDQYLYIQDSSDEPNINDVLYAYGYGLPSNFVTYRGPHPASPYPPYYSLSDYNSGRILETYYNGTDNVGSFATSPTNAGYVPYSPQVWYSERGFGYDNNVTGSGDLVIPIAVSGTSQQSAFSTATAPETNNPNTGEIKADAVNAPMAGTLESAYDYLTGTGGFPALPSTACPAQKYVIFITDGLPTYGLNGNLWPPLGSAAANGYGEAATFNADGSLNTAYNSTTNNDNALIETINEITDLKNQGIDTYVIGLGAGVDPTLNPQAAATLTAMAVAGGTNSYYPATSPAQVASDLSIIIKEIIMSGSYTSPIIHQTSGNSGYIYYSDFKALNQPLWGEGNIFLFGTNQLGQLTGPNGSAIDANGNIITSDSYWDNGLGAGGELQTENSNNRYIFTSSIDSKTGAEQVIPFDVSNDASLETMLGLTSSNYASVCPSASSESACVDDIINFVLNPSADGWKLGAIYHSNPVLITAPNYPYSSTSYQAFKTEYAERQQVLVAGANDGMLHGFDAGSYGTGPGSTATSYGYGTGAELFGYIPPNFFDPMVCPSDTSLTVSKLACWYELTQINTSQFKVEKYYQDFEFVDGSPYVSDVFFNNLNNVNYPINQNSLQNSWHTVLVSGERNGGDSYFALGLTNPANLKNGYPDPLWDFSDSSASVDPMGATWSEPVISYVCLPNPDNTANNGLCGNNPDPASPLVAPEYLATYLAFVGGGYSTNNTAGQAVYALYVEPNPVNTGTASAPDYVNKQELWKFDSANDSNMKYSIPSEIAPVNSSSFNLEAFYVGDLGGQMWAFNIPYGENPSDWTGCRIFASNQTSPNLLQIFYPPALAYGPNNNLWLYFGTGDAEDLDNINSSRPNEFIAINTAGTQGIGECVGTPPNNTPYNENNLTWTNPNSTSYTPPSTSEGWYITLNGQGEKLAGPPTVYDGIVYFTTYIPPASGTCGYGTPKICAVNYLTGAGEISTSANGTVTSIGTGGASQCAILNGNGVPSAPIITSNGRLIVTTSNASSSGPSSPSSGPSSPSSGPSSPPPGSITNLPVPSLPSKLTPTSWFQLP